MKTIGYFEEFMIEGKFIGTKICEEQPDRKIGYSGKETKTSDTDIVLDNKKKIKSFFNFIDIFIPVVFLLQQ